MAVGDIVPVPGVGFEETLASGCCRRRGCPVSSLACAATTRPVRLAPGHAVRPAGRRLTPSMNRPMGRASHGRACFV